MKKKILTIILCTVMLTAAGCADQSKDSVSATTEQEAEAVEGTGDTDTESGEESAEEAVETVKELTPEEAAAQARQKEAEADATDVYESEDGWSVRYNSELVDLEEGKDYVRFTYNGDANATNRIDFRYYPNTSTDLVLAEATIDYDREELSRSEGYFASMPDMWCFNVDVVSNGSSSTRSFTAVEYNDGVLFLEKRGSVETDEERAMLISDTMAAIVDTVEFEDPENQKEYDYVPGKYKLALESSSEEASAYPAYVSLASNHLGTLGYEDPVDIIWYCRDGLIMEDNESGTIHYYDIEGDSLYLQVGDDWIEYHKDLGAAVNVMSITEGEKDVESLKTYENENGWYVYYDAQKFTVKESRDQVDFLYSGNDGSADNPEKLTVEYIDDDSTKDVLEEKTGNYAASEVVITEGYVGGGKDAWGFTATLPASEDGAGSARKLTAVEHNRGVLLFDRPDHSGEDSEEGGGNAFEEIINTFTFTDHYPQEEYEDIPGKYYLNDKKLQQAASNYPTVIRLNEDHTGTFSGNIEKDVIWYSRQGILVEAVPGGNSYLYRVEDDTLYVHMYDEWVEYNEKDDD